MNFLETCRIVVLNLLENKFKVFLTSLGIFVGTMTIIMVIAVGKGGEKQVLDQFTGLSAETVYVNLNYEKFDVDNADKLEKLTLDHVNQIKAESISIVDIYLLNSSYKEITIANENEYVEINAVSENFDKVSNLEIEFGEEINEEDQMNGKNVVVIGGTLAQKYYGVSEAAVGENIKIGNNLYKIKGVLKDKGDGIQGINPDSSIFLPYETGKKIIGDSGIPRIIGLSDSIDNIGKTKKEIMSTLNYMLDDATFYMIDDAGSRIEAALSSAKTMNVLLISVGMIVFIVGGIGIMNVLFLSVRERTREIGILKALGSQNNEILQQFILESAIISCIGGLAGVIASQFVFPILTMTNVAVVDTVEGKIMAFTFAVVTGTLFGIYPAYKASKLKPIEALLVE